MASNEHSDDLVMTLVESALSRPPEERDEFLREVRESNPSLYEEVSERLRWEERLGGFLREPLVPAAATPSTTGVFEPGMLVGGRFRILEEVGRGGMGFVYRGFDEKLDQPVAIKTARSGFRSRIPPEARLAREVSHFHICKVHEVHSATSADGDPVDFITMEFVEGPTLAQRLQSSGPLPSPEARTLARQICLGLAQAHRQHVIHGDLKPGNVILARSHERELRAVITDFGLAKPRDYAVNQVPSSAPGGTLDYMAPELFLGSPVSPASDIYALGVLFHAVLAGHVPERSQAIPLSAPSSDSEAPTQTLAEVKPGREWHRRVAPLPAPWNTIVEKCLEPDPARRYASVDEISAALEPPRPRWPWWTAAAAILALVVLALWLWLSPTPSDPPVRLAILPLDSESPLATGLGNSVAELLAGSRARFIVFSPREAVRDRVDSPARALAAWNATHVLQARLRRDGTQYAAVASLLDLASNQAVREFSARYAESELPQFARALSATVAATFHLRATSADTIKPEALPLYLEALQFLRRDSDSADFALPLLERARALDPRAVPIYAAFAEACLQKQNRTRDPQWLTQASQAIAQAQSVNPDSAPLLFVSGLLKQRQSLYENALADYRRATELAPQDPETWRRLGVVYELLQRPAEAVPAFQKAISLDPSYHRAYIDLGLFHYNRGDFAAAEPILRQVTVLTPGLDLGWTNLGADLKQLGRFPEAEQAFQKSIAIRSAPIAWLNLGNLYFTQERYNDALAAFGKGLAAGPPTMILMRNLGDTHTALRHPADAARFYARARTMAEDQLTLNPRDTATRAFLGLMCAFLGDPARAEFELSQALRLEPQNANVIRNAVFAYEHLRQREKSLTALQPASAGVLLELRRTPGGRELALDPRFQQLLTAKQ